MPWTCFLMGNGLETSLRRFLRHSVSNTPAEFGRFLQDLILQGKVKVPYLDDVLRYELAACTDRVIDYEPLLYRARGLEISNGTVLPLALKPRVHPQINVESFDYDMERLIHYLEKREFPPVQPKQKSFVIFQPGARNYQINTASAELIPLLDGSLSIAAIHSDVARQAGITSREQQELLMTNIQRFFRELLEWGIIGLQ